MKASPRERSTTVRKASTSTTRTDDDSDDKKHDDYEEGRITVSVRVRPINAREAKLATGSCVAALPAYNTLYIFPPSETQHDFDALLAQNPQLRGVSHHRFTFDHVYPTEATQEQVYEQIGHPVLQSSFRGYHTCIFAYGQTGSGKSYCMMGADGGRAIDNAPGIIPRLCSEMFAEMATRRAAAAEHDEQLEFSVYVSYLEIYRERVRSLLDEATDAKLVAATEPATPRSTVNALRRTAAALQSFESADGTLRVREHPTLGVYVEGLAEIPVTSVDQVMRLMVRGNNRRHTASTRMNDTSSRSHAIFTIQLLQQRQHTVPPGLAATAAVASDKTSVAAEGIEASASAAAAPVTATTQLGAKINLVDLAGSERAKATGAEGDTLKEGAQINKSLTTLGIVINALAAQSTASSNSSGGGGGASPRVKPGGAAKRHIPYRDSTLTFLLKESLGGNSKTFMIATVSPSSDNYDESVSTLRYADRAKAIVMRAFVNETAGDKRIRELEEEVTRLRDLIKALLDAEATRASARQADASPSLQLSPSPRGVPEPVVLADSTSLPLTGGVDTDGMLGAATSDADDDDDSGATDMGGATPRGGDEEYRASHESDERETSQTPQRRELSAGPSLTNPAAQREAVVDTLQSELRRAEEMIRQMSVRQAERDAHIAQLVGEQERERAATRAAAEAAAAAQREAERVAAEAAATAAAAVVPSSPVQMSTMRLNRDEPYLLNMDGAGDWVVAHLGPSETLVGVARARKRRPQVAARATGREAVNSGEEKSPDESYDSSLTLPSSEKATSAHMAMEDEEEELSEEESDVTAAVRYVKLPRELCEGVGGPHCVLERSVGSPTGTTSTVTLRGCDGYTTYVIRPLSQTPLTVRGSADALQLQSGDVLDIGQEHIQLKYMDPSAPPLTARGRRPTSMRIGHAFPVASSGGEDNTESERAGSSLATSPFSKAALHEALHQKQQQQLQHTSSAGGRLTREGEDPSHSNEGEENAASQSDTEEREEQSNGDQRSDDSRMDSPTEQPGRTVELPSRPVIPTLALGKALPTSSLPLVFQPASLQQQQHHHRDPAGMAGIDGGPTGSSTSLPSSSEWTSSTTHPNATRRNSNEKMLTIADVPAPAVAPPPAVPFTSRKLSKRAEAAAAAAAAETAVPHAALTSAELQSMRSTALSSTYRSELPATFVGRYNFVLVGPSGGGKTSLVSNLAAPDQPLLRSVFSAFTSSARGTSSAPAVHPTIGIQARTLTAPGSIPVSLHTQELGGTPCFSPLLDQLPSHRVSYLLCFPLHGLTSLMTLRGVVEDILCRTDSHTVSLVLVGTHADRNATGREDGSYLARLPQARQDALHRQLEEVEQQVVSLIQMLQPYAQLRPTVVGRFAVDNVHRHVYTTGYQSVESFPQWLQWLADVARDRCKADADFANGLVPARCLELGRQVSLLRQHGKWCVSLRDFKALAAAVSSQYRMDAAEPARAASQLSAVARDSLRHHVQLLADWGVLMHRYRSLQLRQHVILDVVWLSRLLAALACSPLIAAAASDGLSVEEAATMVDVVGEEGTMSLTRKEAALRTLLTPEAERVVDMVKVATTDTPHLLRSGVLSLPVLIAMLEPHFTRVAAGGGDGQKAMAVGRMMDNTTAGTVKHSMSLEPRGRSAFPPQLTSGAEKAGEARMTRYAVPLAGVVELLSLLDLIIVGRKLAFSPAATAGPTRGPFTPSAIAEEGKTETHEGDEEAIEKESFVLYPLSFRTPASAGVTWIFPCFLSGPFYVFKMDMVPRNFFPKLLCRLSTVCDRVYLGPVEKKLWGSATQRWERSSSTSSATRRADGAGRSAVPPTAAVVGPFDTYFEQRGGQPFELPSFAPYLATTTAEGRLRRRDGFWFDAAWLVYHGDDSGSGCRVLVRLVHHSVFLSFHCHGVAAAANGAGGGGGNDDARRASAGVQDFYEAVLEAVRYVVEEFPGGKCEEFIQCWVDSATLLQAEQQQHPALQTDQEAAAQERYLRFASISNNINNLERVLAKSGAALRTARTARRPNAVLPAGVMQHNAIGVEDDESEYVPLLRNFSAAPPLSIHECIRRWKAEQRLHIAPDVEARLTTALHQLEECYHGDALSDSCGRLDALLDVLARVDTA